MSFRINNSSSMHEAENILQALGIRYTKKGDIVSIPVESRIGDFLNICSTRGIHPIEVPG